MTRKRRRRRRGDARGERRDGGGGGSWNGMNSRGTRSGASGRQLRKTVQGEPSEITGGDDSIGNDGVNTASWKHPARPIGLTTRKLFRVPFNNLLLLLSCLLVDFLFVLANEEKEDRRIYIPRIYNFNLKQLPRFDRYFIDR